MKQPENEKISIFEALKYAGEEGERIELASGKWTIEKGALGLGRRDDLIQARFLSHLKFFKKLDELQEYNLPPEKLIEFALKLTEVCVHDETAVGATYEESLQNIADSISELAEKLEVYIGEESDVSS